MWSRLRLLPFYRFFYLRSLLLHLLLYLRPSLLYLLLYLFPPLLYLLLRPLLYLFLHSSARCRAGYRGESGLEEDGESSPHASPPLVVELLSGSSPCCE